MPEVQDIIPTHGQRIRPPEDPIEEAAHHFFESKGLKLGCLVASAIGSIAVCALLTAIVWSAVNAARARAALEEANRLVVTPQFAAAIPWYTAALRGGLSEEDRATAYGNRGWAETKINRDVDAIADFTAALRLRAGLVDAVLDRGLAYHRQGKFSQALADYDRTIRLNPNEPDAYGNRASIRTLDGELRGAIEDMNEVIRCKPADARSYVIRANLYLAENELESALASFDSAVRNDPENAEAFRGRAEIYERRGELVEV